MITSTIIWLAWLIAGFLGLFEEKAPTPMDCAVCGQPADRGQRCRRCRNRMKVASAWHVQPNDLPITTVAQIYLHEPPEEIPLDQIPF